MELSSASDGRKNSVMAMNGTSGRNRKSQWLRLSMENVVTSSSTVAAPPANSASRCVVRSDDGKMTCVDSERSAPNAKPNGSTGSAKRRQNGPLCTGSGLKMGMAWRTA